jgi:hypothetical protein
MYVLADWRKKGTWDFATTLPSRHTRWLWEQWTMDELPVPIA